jgi:hypothetical protein
MMADSPNPPQPIGPFVCAVTSTVLSSALLILFFIGMKLTMARVLSVVIPLMSVATTLVAVSMGWAFVAMGRYKTKPRWVWAMGILIAVTMLELLVATYLTEGAS